MRRYCSDSLGEFDARSFALLCDMHASRSPLAGLGLLLLHAFNQEDELTAVRRETRDARRLDWIDRETVAWTPLTSVPATAMGHFST